MLDKVQITVQPLSQWAGYLPTKTSSVLKN